MEKVSIVVAAYNIENYISKCLESIVNQTYGNLEIIVVNDGSKDNTIEKINNFAKLDRRIVVINKNNEGLSEARLSGYNQSTGEYILFVDGDDWLENDAIEILYNECKKYKCDIACFDCIVDYGKTKVNAKKSIGECKIYNYEEFLEELLIGKIQPSIWNKFIRRNFIEENKVEWPRNITYAEDVATSCSLAINNPKVILVKSELYHYYQRESSITKNITDSVYDINKAIEFVKKQLNDKGLLDKYIKEFEYLAFIHNYYRRLNIIFDYKSQYSKNLFIIWKNNNININNNKYIKNELKKESMGYRFYVTLLDKSYSLAKIYSKIRGIRNEN
ncbi:glycosyltransferase [Clostridium perfringens]|uniref:glycosyltransferase family 2 protein n=1 Tax=Clostridium perfringens TaxID=1502 RepID=UPI002AC460C2|nr:glycosyltransferase family 2 protein [Clostridium perfringens]MDZ4983575.1 glycosyltransferase [Clostridium perfringens]